MNALTSQYCHCIHVDVCGGKTTNFHENNVNHVIQELLINVMKTKLAEDNDCYTKLHCKLIIHQQPISQEQRCTLTEVRPL